MASYFNTKPILQGETEAKTLKRGRFPKSAGKKIFQVNEHEFFVSSPAFIFS